MRLKERKDKVKLYLSARNNLAKDLQNMLMHKLKAIAKTAKFVLGIVLLIIGIVGLVMPIIPGIICIGAGLFMLGKHEIVLKRLATIKKLCRRGRIR